MDRNERREFVRKHRTCVFGYNRKDDGPAMTVVYYVMDGDDLLVSTMAARGKARAVKRNSKVSLCILDEQWPLTYLQVYGEATLEEDFGLAVDVLRRVVDLMAGEDVSSAKLPEIERMAREEDRVVIRVRPYATFATPPRHVYKAADLDTLTHFTSSSQPWLSRYGRAAPPGAPTPRGRARPPGPPRPPAPRSARSSCLSFCSERGGATLIHPVPGTWPSSSTSPSAMGSPTPFTKAPVAHRLRKESSGITRRAGAGIRDRHSS
jgi:PPOX class probable F420-dependent enzyme